MHARQLAAVRHLTQAYAAQAELTVDRVRAATTLAAGVAANRELRGVRQVLGKVTIELPAIDEQRRLGELMREIDAQASIYRQAAETSERFRQLAFEGMLSGEVALS